MGSYVLVGPDEATPADRADAWALLKLRRQLLADDAIQGRIECLAHGRPAPDDSATSIEQYRHQVESLTADLDGHLTPGEIDRLAAAVGSRDLPLLILRTGHARRRARAPGSRTIELVAGSLVLRAGGLLQVEADEAVADWASRDGRIRTASTIGVYRWRLRQIAERRGDRGVGFGSSPVLGPVQ